MLSLFDAHSIPLVSKASRFNQRKKSRKEADSFGLFPKITRIKVTCLNFNVPKYKDVRS